MSDPVNLAAFAELDNHLIPDIVNIIKEYSELPAWCYIGAYIYMNDNNWLATPYWYVILKLNSYDCTDGSREWEIDISFVNNTFNWIINHNKSRWVSCIEVLDYA